MFNKVCKLYKRIMKNDISAIDDIETLEEAKEIIKMMACNAINMTLYSKHFDIATTIGDYDTDKPQTIKIKYNNTEIEDVLWDARPSCKHQIQAQPSGGVKCINCGGWFCY